MEKHILLLGGSGFVGRHLTGLLLEAGYEVTCLDREIPLDPPAGCRVLAADLEDVSSIQDLPRDWFGVIHLAGASVPSLFTSAAPVLSNLHMTMNLLDHLRSARVLLVSSCHVYAPSSERRVEEAPIAPQGRYGLSKHLLEQVAPHYVGKLDVRIARPFNHLGPGQRPELVIPALLRRLTSHPKDDVSPIVMSGMNSTRDFIDVRDVVSAYRAILELETPLQHTFNVCTGRGHCIGDVIHTVQGLLGTNRPVRFESHPNSSDDIPYLVGDPGRLQRTTGWKPRCTLSDSLHAMMESIHP